MAINPGNIAFSMPPAEDDQVRKQRDLERTTRENAAARSLAASQIGNGGILQVDGSLNINGAAAVAGSLTVSGTLSVPAGSLNTAGSISAGTALSAGTTITAGGAVSGASVTATGAVSGGSLSSSGDVSATGNLSANGTASIGGLVTANAGVTSNDIRSRLLTSSYVAVYADGSGRLGYVPSSLKVKTVTGAYVASLEDWLAVKPQIFYYNEDADKTPRVGFIAEWVNVHFPEFVVHDNVAEEEGTHPAGLHYEFMIAGLQSAFQQFVAEQRAETNALKARLDALGG